MLQILRTFFPAILATSALSASVDPLEDSIVGQSTYPYRLFVPANGETPLPLIVYLAGLGEKGTDNTLQVQRHIQPLLDITQSPESPYAAIVLAPQSQSGWWDGDSVNALVDEIERSYAIDPYRTYITGMSAGGGGCYVTLASRPNRWAAALPLSAVRDADAISKITNIPIWMIHGTADEIVPSSASQQVYDELVLLGSTPRLTLIDKWDHNNWAKVYADNKSYTQSYEGGTPKNALTGIYPWLFSHSTAPSTRNSLSKEKVD
ncbi:hypothetical protein MLD52_13095 [Puniceicoccaceae bacterium K14]|nr:hypothetical protein [Puniceicoccaceae bacterium K14]